MAKLSTFQLIFIIVFVVFIIGGTLIFAGYIKIGKDKTATPSTDVPIVIWGVEKSSLMKPLIDSLNSEKQLRLSYVEIPKNEFKSRLIDEFASGGGPDLFLMQESDIWELRDKIYTIPYESYPERTFESTFVESAYVYEGPSGIVGVPFMIDPMVLYYNRDMFNDASIAVPPVSWSEFGLLTPKLTVKDEEGTLFKSAIGMGRFENLVHGDDIYALLALQSGNPITVLDKETGKLTVTLADRGETTSSRSGGSYALDFFTSFANPTNRNYTWNRGLADDLSSFISEHLAMYMGFASELPLIRAKNPNLNFDVTFVPQSGVTSTRMTLAHLSAFAIPKNAPNKSASISAAYQLTSKSVIEKLNTATLLPPVRRDLYASRPSDPFFSVYYDSALQAKAWRNPNAIAVHSIFTEMANALISGVVDSQSAVFDAVNKMTLVAQ
jgi:ABC-type glycerol-3-phosphate transport system substrate-binding protein